MNQGLTQGEIEYRAWVIHKIEECQGCSLFPCFLLRAFVDIGRGNQNN